MDSSICPIDREHHEQISTLLKPPSPHQVQEYFEEILETRTCSSLMIRQDGTFGKGLYANVEFGEDELVLKDQMLVGAQHTLNKVDCLVCSYCFRFIGSVELQIGRKLYFQNLMECATDSSDGETHNHIEDNESGQCSSSNSKEKIPLPMELIESLRNGDVQLPYSKQFSLPSAVPCSGQCEEAYYCSKLCAEADWAEFHSLLCPGDRSGPECREALLKFIEHANGTNDVFYLAAKAISSTILRYRKIKKARFQGQEKNKELIGSANTFSILSEAWKPISMGYKKRWWDCVALPGDVDDEASFRGQMRDLAFESLQLLKEAIFDEECAPLFSLEIYGHIIGMFELNNLDLVVASPVEDYFLYIEDLQEEQKEHAEKATRPYLDALGDEYSICCDGSAFFPLHSCLNHSCDPNAKAFKRDEDRDGQAIISAIRPIQKGEEITISYIDEDLPWKERQALLADYGFKCKCSKCLEEEGEELLPKKKKK
ncbi:Histone-lysine N-methyltransferase atxr2 [Ranunculus cassubicifolius]